MSLLNNSLLLGAPAAATGYSIPRSLRFNSSDSAYLSKTFSSAATSSQKLTYSTWVKRTVVNSATVDHFGLSAAIAGSSVDAIRFAPDIIQVFFDGADAGLVSTTAVFRDVSAWYHVVVAIDTTKSTDADRVIIYVNGTRQSVTATQPSQNYNFTGFLVSGKQQNIGRNPLSAFYTNSYLADTFCIDGQALTPSSFGETDANGIWQPKAYSGSYGTNGFHLDFADNSAATAAALGKDTSGNGNNWTPNNLSVTAGADNDSLVDSPTNGTASSGGDAGGTVVGNYATFNPISTLTTVTLANGNLDYSSTTASKTAIATIGISSNKFYWEVSTTAGTTETQVGVYGTSASTLYSLAANSTVYGIRFDADAGTLDRTTDGTTWTSIATGLTSGPYFPYFNNNGTTAKTVSANFGQRPFAYAAPSGFKALCTQNLPTPTILKGSDYFDTKLYTGNGSTQTISGLAFSPDLVWMKGRSGATDHALYDIVRGAQADLVSNSTAAETTQSTGLTAFGSTSFNIGSLAKINTSSATYAAWCWDAGTSTVTNTAGSITSTVRANPSAGFSIVTYTGNGTVGATVGHGLGVTPGMVIVKNRSAAADWPVKILPYMTGGQRLELDTTNAITAEGPGPGSLWNATNPNSTVITLGNQVMTNTNTNNYVAYCFAPVSGYSNGFSYTGNGSADGSFVYLGFRPRLVLLKCSSTTGNWTLVDTAREGYNVDNDPLYPNLSGAEGTTDLLDITSNGFKLRTTDASVNSSGATYVGFAWAESPFSIARAR